MRMNVEKTTYAKLKLNDELKKIKTFLNKKNKKPKKSRPNLKAKNIERKL
jgi:hypothetical protein